jgi:hypothetical protein
VSRRGGCRRLVQSVNKHVNNMADALRKTVTKFTDVAFPVSKTNRESSQHHALRAGILFNTFN